MNVIFKPWMKPAPGNVPKIGIPNTEWVDRMAVATIGVKLTTTNRITQRCKKHIADLEVGFVSGQQAYLVYDEKLGKVAI